MPLNALFSLPVPPHSSAKVKCTRRLVQCSHRPEVAADVPSRRPHAKPRELRSALGSRPVPGNSAKHLGPSLLDWHEHGIEIVQYVVRCVRTAPYVVSGEWCTQYTGCQLVHLLVNGGLCACNTPADKTKRVRLGRESESGEFFARKCSRPGSAACRLLGTYPWDVRHSTSCQSAGTGTSRCRPSTIRCPCRRNR